MIIKKDKKKVSLIHCGHEFAYLYGLLSGFYKKGFFHLDIIDSVRPPDEAHGFNDEHDFRFFSFLGGTKKNPILKGLRWGAYYMRLIPYLLFNKSYIVHIEWINSQFSGFEEIMLPFIIKKIRHQKLVYTVHDVSSKLLLKKTGEDYDVKPNRTKLFFYNSVDVFIVHNEFTQKILIDFGVASEKIQILKHGLNIFAPFTGKGKAEVRKELKINNDDKVVLFFGNISPYKNIEALIDAVSVVKKTHKEVKLLIVGNFRKGLQQYKKQIDDKCDELLKGSVIRELKFINYADIEKYFVAADVLCLPYKFVFQSGVLFLAYRYGTFVISRNVGGIPEDIEVGTTGLVYENDEDLSNSLLTFFSSTSFNDKKLNEKIREFGKENYSWEKISLQLMAVYNRLIEQ